MDLWLYLLKTYNYGIFKFPWYFLDTTVVFNQTLDLTVYDFDEENSKVEDLQSIK
jgi:hypothetical protein